MLDNLLLCSDLDRTLLPNGELLESKSADEIFRRLCSETNITLCYATGRNIELTMNAIDEYNIPNPEYLICDVGASIYCLEDTHYTPLQSWRDEIESDWNGINSDMIIEVLDDIENLDLQDKPHQHTYKISYSTTSENDLIKKEIYRRLDLLKLNINLITSFDENEKIELIDILPKSVSKLHAILFLMGISGFSYDNTIFAGDSGNDMDVFTSGMPSVIVKNAPQSILDYLDELEKDNSLLNLYRATGSYLGMNGNYKAGVLEGLAHHHPEFGKVIERISKDL